MKPAAPAFLGIAGFFGLCVMMYTGVMLSTLKSRAFWATPALPILFTISALSTGCAAIVLSIGGWPAEFTLINLLASEVVHELLHVIDVVLVCTEIVVLFTMVLSFAGAGTPTAQKVAKRWLKGSYAPLFWVGMVLIGLLIPLALYLAGWGIASGVVAPILVLCGGCLLRFMVVFSDDRTPIPGEERYHLRTASHKDEFVSKWTYGENLF